MPSPDQSPPNPALRSAAQALQTALALLEQAAQPPTPRPTTIPRLLTARQVAGVLGLSIQHTYALMQTNRLPTVRIGRAVRVPEPLLQAYIDALITRDIDAAGAIPPPPDRGAVPHRPPRLLGRSH